MRPLLTLALAAAVSGCDMVSAAVGGVPACHDPRVLQSIRDIIAEAAVSGFSGSQTLTELAGELARENHLIFDSPIEITASGSPGRQCVISSTFDPRPMRDITYPPADIHFQIFSASDGSGPTVRVASRDIDRASSDISISALAVADRAR